MINRSLGEKRFTTRDSEDDTGQRIVIAGANKVWVDRKVQIRKRHFASTRDRREEEPLTVDGTADVPSPPDARIADDVHNTGDSQEEQPECHDYQVVHGTTKLAS